MAAATATRDLPDADGEMVPAAALQVASPAGPRDLFAIVVRTSDKIAA